MNTFTAQVTDLDMHLAQLLGTMSLVGPADIAREEPIPAPAIIGSPDASMSDLSDIEDLSHQLNPSVSSHTNRNCGCAYLQAIQGQVRSGLFSTTGGEYLEAIFTHRETFSAFPAGHKECAIAFSDLAEELAGRGSRADRDGDAEAVTAFRYEAWVIANASEGDGLVW